MNELDLFVSAIALTDPAERAAYLDRACAGNPDLRRRLEELLSGHARGGNPLDRPADAPAGASATSDVPVPENTATFVSASGTADWTGRDEQPGVVLAGRYRLVERIGDGGMGSVWVAHQTEPVRRAVAVKLIKAGMDSRQVLARFEVERQALALMDHPNIARVLDAGATPDGRPFFVMELVKGVPITKYCDQRKLTPRERLELFVPVCNAIQHAHQKGVIHRDIKPSNVLVALYDDRPVPKVIDFGVAKAAGQPLTEHTLATGFGAVVGTPEYMSPEQASFNNLDIDTRSDVYALGVLLYELLAGSPPFSRKTLEQAGLLEIFRVIRELEPPKPSAKLSTADALPTLSANRGTEPKRLTALLRGELDWIVMKALEKDRTRRYETANGFAADVQRYLVGEPVQAVPPSAGYRLRKFVRKNRGPVLAGAVVFLALVAGVVGATWGLFSADKARRAAEAAEANERVERGKADAARIEADEQRQKAERQAASATIDLLDQIGDERATLQLARMVGTLPPQAADLRQYLTMRLITDLQHRCPLAPPLEGTGGPGEIQASYLILTPDGRYLIGRLGNEVVVWETLTHRRVARLREGNESLQTTLPFGYSRRANLAYTRSEDGVVRLWEVPSGRLVLRADPITEFVGRPLDRRSASRMLVSDKHLLIQHSNRTVLPNISILELWDIAGRRRVAVWPRDEVPVKDYQGDNYDLSPSPAFKGWNSTQIVAFSPDGRTILLACTEGTVQVRRTSDGGLIKVLSHPDVQSVGFSPSGRRAVTVSLGELRWWRTDTWEPEGPVARFRRPSSTWGKLTDDAAVFSTGNERSGELVRFGFSDTIDFPSDKEGWAAAGRRITGGQWVLDIDSGKLSYPPAGSRYHPAAVDFAEGGRWLQFDSRIIDLAAQKPLASRHNRPVGYTVDKWVQGMVPTDMFNGVRMPSGGYAAFRLFHPFGSRDLVYVLPPMLDVAPDMLELWVQLVLRGELGPDDEVRPWDEATWERKRQELAARAKPAADFPFPGRIVSDRLYWLRTEIQSRYDRGGQYLSRGNPPPDAEVWLGRFDRMIAGEPALDWYVLRGGLRAKLQRWHAAADDFLAALRLTNGMGHEAWEWEAGPGKSVEQYQAEVRLAEARRQYYPESWSPAYRLGIAYYRAGRYRDAVRLLKEANERVQIDVVVSRVLGPALMSPWAAAVAASNPPRLKYPATLLVLAMAHHQLGEADAARDRLAEARANLAELEPGKWGEAEPWVREAVELIEGPPAKK